MAEPAVILHLSDIQFGGHHRFTGRTLPATDEPVDPLARYGNDEAYKTLFAKLEEDLELLKAEHGLRANILVISGDLAEWSLQEEYNKVKNFIESLLNSSSVDIDRNRLILVPGNHDVNWLLCESYFLECNAHRKLPEAPYSRKFLFWEGFLNDVLKRDAGVSRPIWQGYDLRKYGVLIVGLNSSIRESHRAAEHYGWVGLSQIKEAVGWFDSTDRSHQFAHIAVLHHNVLPATADDEENLRDWDDVRVLFEKTVDIILHGHRHEHYRTDLGTLDARHTMVLAAGSAGLDAATLPACPNQYQLIRIKGQDVSLYLRSYTEQGFRTTGRGHFRADSDAKGNWIYSFRLPGLSLDAPSPSSSISDDSLSASFEDFVESSRNATHQRLLREEEKVGPLLQLDCQDIRSQQTTDLESVLKAWLTGNVGQMVILGAAGSGKTISCLQLCEKVLSDRSTGEWLPIYLDLSRFAAADDALEIIGEHFRGYGLSIKPDQILTLLEERRFLICLDSFDEYEKAEIPASSDRTFEGFQHLRRPNIKVLITCRSNFFRRPEDVFIFELRTREFELCPSSAIVVELSPLAPSVVSRLLAQHVDSPVPDWLCRLADRPLYLRMLVPLLRARAIDISQDLKRHELYERFVTYVLNWDLLRRPTKISLEQSRSFHTALAERFLAKGLPSLPDVEIFHVVEEVFKCKRTEDRFAELLFFFRQSGLLRFEDGRIVFSHKSYREYLVAKRIVDLIALDDHAFDFIWFTRNERDFIVAMLSESEKETLCRWLSDEGAYPACNYASFILGGTRDKRMIPCLRQRLDKTNDSLIKINCTNALAALGENDVRGRLMGAIAGYTLAEGLSTIMPTGAEKDALEWIPSVRDQFRRSVMLIHLCETIDALGMCGDENAVDLMRQLEQAPDKSVVDEAKGALRRLVNRIGDSQQVDPKRTGRGSVDVGIDSN